VPEGGSGHAVAAHQTGEAGEKEFVCFGPNFGALHFSKTNILKKVSNKGVLMATIVRLPNPAMVDDFLRDLASVQKLKKALGQALQALEPGPKKEVEEQFKIKSAGKAVEAFLQKGTPATSEDKGYLDWLIREIGHRAQVGLSFHPGFVDERPLDTVEVKAVDTAVQTIAERVKQIVDTNGYDTQITNVFGSAILPEVKKRFMLSLEALISIHKADKIVVDTMQKQKVWACGGLTSEKQIALPDKLKEVSSERTDADLSARDDTRAAPGCTHRRQVLPPP
jgi:hypothetical protein